MPRNAATQNNNTENMEQQVPFKVTITEHNPERGVLANADVNVAGGIGGGDIKLTGACGLVFGFERTLAGLLMALSLLLLFHVVRQCIRKIRKLNCVAEKEQAYPLVPFLLVGMVISVFMFL